MWKYVVVLVSCGRDVVLMRMMIGGLLTSLNSSGTMSCVAPRDDNSRKKVRNVRGDSSGRPHASLGPGIPEGSGAELARTSHGHRIRADCRVVAEPVLAGLHHEYRLEPRAA
jgi:hypothetical protein